MEKIVTIENEYIFNKDNNEHIEVKMITRPSMDTVWSILNEDLDMINIVATHDSIYKVELTCIPFHII